MPSLGAGPPPSRAPGRSSPQKTPRGLLLPTPCSPGAGLCPPGGSCLPATWRGGCRDRNPEEQGRPSDAHRHPRQPGCLPRHTCWASEPAPALGRRARAAAGPPTAQEAAAHSLTPAQGREGPSGAGGPRALHPTCPALPSAGSGQPVCTPVWSQSRGAEDVAPRSPRAGGSVAPAPRQRATPLSCRWGLCGLRTEILSLNLKSKHGDPGGLSGGACPFGPGRDPGVPASGPTPGSPRGACFSLCLRGRVCQGSHA
ncbi:hypothetical protein VULLAG_LOCUS22931 [Vulpes lagopus]